MITKVAEQIELNNTLTTIKKIFQNIDTQSKNDQNTQHISKIKNVLGALGMLGEKGTNDIIEITLSLLEKNNSFANFDFASFENKFGDNALIVKQRMRRAIKNGLTNIANLGAQDYGNDIFHMYAGVLYDFSNVKAEMDCIRSKNSTGGKVSLNKFFEGLVYLCQTE